MENEMAWTDRYLPPVVKTESLRFAAKKFFRDAPELLRFALLPHKEVEKPPADLPEIKKMKEGGLKVVEKIYDSSLNRIESLERKAFNLLSYVTATITILALTYAQFTENSYRWLLLLPLGLLLLTLYVSFRCLKVKTIQQVFVNDIYQFDSDGSPIKEGIQLHRSFLAAATFNETKADAVADMLRATRILLGLSIGSLLAVVLAVAIIGRNNTGPSKAEIQLAQITKGLERLDSTVNKIALREQSLEQLKSRMDTLSASVAEMTKSMQRPTTRGKRQ
jgi:hypothetical protein